MPACGGRQPRLRHEARPRRPSPPAARTPTRRHAPLSRRILKTTSNGGVTGTVANGTSRYLQDGNQIVEELNSSNATLRQFVWGMYIDELVQLKTYASTGSQPLAAGVYYPLQDLLYRTTALTNASGSIVEAYDTDAYGNTLIYSGPGADGQWFTNDDVASVQPACEYLFTGREYDPETQIYFYRARYYMPGLGRFGGRDPLYLLGSNPYEYVESRPLVRVDSLGFKAGTAHGSGNPGASMCSPTLTNNNVLPAGPAQGLDISTWRQFVVGSISINITSTGWTGVARAEAAVAYAVFWTTDKVRAFFNGTIICSSVRMDNCCEDGAKDCVATTSSGGRYDKNDGVAAIAVQASETQLGGNIVTVQFSVGIATTASQDVNFGAGPISGGIGFPGSSISTTILLKSATWRCDCAG